MASKNKQQGFVLYFDNLDALNKQIAKGLISAADAFAVVSALGVYAQMGIEPDGLSPAASMAFEMMVSGVKRSIEAYQEKTKKTRQAAQARWSADASAQVGGVQMDADASECMQTHADASECMQMQGIEQNRTELNKESIQDIETSAPAREGSKAVTPSLPSFDLDDEDLVAQSEINRQIEEAGRKAKVFTHEWESAHPDARDEYEDFQLMLEYPAKWVLEAIDKARLAHKTSSRYVLGILRSFRQKGKSDAEIKADVEAEKQSASRASPVVVDDDGTTYIDGYEVFD